MGVWDEGRGRREGGSARSLCTSSSCRLQERSAPPTSPRSGAHGNISASFSKNKPKKNQTSNDSATAGFPGPLHSVTAIPNRLPPETFPGADVSMSLPGKVAAVLLLGLLAAQGKRRAPPRATTRCRLPPKKKKKKSGLP